MYRKINLLVILLSVIAILSFSKEVKAEEKTHYLELENYSDKNVTQYFTSDNSVIVIEASISGFGKHKLIRMGEEQIEKQIELDDVWVEYKEYNGKGYIFVFEDYLKIYDEQLKVVFSQNFSKEILVREIDKRYHFIDFLDGKQYYYLDLEKLTFVEEKEVPSSSLRLKLNNSDEVVIDVRKNWDTTFQEIVIPNAREILPSGFNEFNSDSWNGNRGKIFGEYYIFNLETRYSGIQDKILYNGLFVVSKDGIASKYIPLPKDDVPESMWEWNGKWYVYTSNFRDGSGKKHYEVDIEKGNVKLIVQENTFPNLKPLFNSEFERFGWIDRWTVRDYEMNILYNLIDGQNIINHDHTHLFNQYIYIYPYEGDHPTGIYDLSTNMFVKNFQNASVKPIGDNKILVQEIFDRNNEDKIIIYVEELKFSDRPDISGVWYEWETPPNITDPNHTWTITLNNSVNAQTVNKQTLFVTDENGERVTDIKFEVKEDKIEVYAPKAGYNYDEQYTLYIRNNIKSSNGQKLKTSIKMPFTISKSEVTISYKLSSFQHKLELPEEIELTVDGKVEKVKVKEKVIWNEDTLKQRGENSYTLIGKTKISNKRVTLELILEESYFKSFIDGVAMPFLMNVVDSDVESYQGAKMLEYIYNQIIDDPKALLSVDELLAAQIKRTVPTVIMDAYMDRILTDGIFDEAIPAEKEISSCLSDMFSARISLSTVDMNNVAGVCIDKIFDYLSESTGINFTDGSLTNEKFEKALNSTKEYSNGFSEAFKIALEKEYYGVKGYWLLTFGDFKFERELIHIEEQDNLGKIKGKRFLIYKGREFKFNIEGEVVQPLYGNSELRFKSYWTKPAVEKYMETQEHTFSTYRESEYYDTFKISLGYIENRGSYKSFGIDLDGYRLEQAGEHSIVLTKVDPDLGWFRDEFDYIRNE